MSISKFAVDYHKKDEGGHYEDYDYGTNLKKKVKKQKTEEKVEVKMDDNFQKSLPIELILEFLSRLPVKSLTRLSCAKVRSPDSGLLLTSTYGATGGAGASFWRTSDPQVILLFDLHEDKLQYIRIPVERNAVKRLFEHKKSFVVAILQKKSLPVEGINTKTAHTLEKVHLKILKAYKDDQVWDKETIDLSTYSIPFSDNFLFVSFSDQILLYWADPKSFQFFNLHRKCLKVVKNICSGMSKKRLPRAAGAKDYWLNCEVENICSLKALLPVRTQKSDRAALNSMMESFQNMWTLQQPNTTVGGFFCSYYQSKTSEYYFFDD